jgi:hypothetical protein
MFECVDAASSYPPPPLIVVKGTHLTWDYFAEGLPQGTRVVMSENVFTTNGIAVTFLQHYIDNSNSGPDPKWKIMLMDNHGSYCTPEFITLANENHIRPFPLIPHLTHCM